MEFLEQLQSQSAVVARAPFVFALLVVSAIVAAYALARLHFGREIANLNSTVKLKEAEIADWQRKTKGTTPDDVRARLDALEAAQRGRRLTEIQSDSIVRAGSHPGGDLIAMYIHNVVGVADAAKYAADLRRAFSKAGWRVSGSNLVTGHNVGDSGLLVSVDNELDNLSVGEATVLAALRAAGVRFEVQRAGAPQGAIHMFVGDSNPD